MKNLLSIAVVPVTSKKGDWAVMLKKADHAPQYVKYAWTKNEAEAYMARLETWLYNEVLCGEAMSPHVLADVDSF